jgi:hypothetical protein
MQAGGEILHSKIHELINSICNTGKIPINGKSLLSYQFTERVINLTAVIIGGYQYYQLGTMFYPIFFSHAEVIRT